MISERHRFRTTAAEEEANDAFESEMRAKAEALRLAELEKIPRDRKIELP